MKQWLVILLGALAGLAQAQTVDWDAAFNSCSREGAAFDRWAIENSAFFGNERATWQAEKRNFKSSYGSSPSASALRSDLAANRPRLAGSGGNPNLALTVCAQQAALNQLQSAATQSASPSPSRSSPPPPISRGNGRNQPDKVAVHCMDDASSGAMRNTCNQQVNVRWCSMDYGAQACGSGNLGWADVPPGGNAALPRDVKVLMIACAAPTRPTDIEYTPGSGFLYNCTQ